jgi:hypothetical protein
MRIGLWQWLHAGLNAKRAWRAHERRLSKMDGWNQAQSKEKANVATGRVIVGGTSAATVVAMVLGIIVKLTDLKLSIDEIATISSAVALVAGPVWAWLRTYFVDKANHGGQRNIFAALAKPKEVSE